MQIGNLRIGSSRWGCNYGDACFPNRYLKKDCHSQRFGTSAQVYLTAILEYLAVEVWKLARNAAKDNKKNRIILRHVLSAMRNDEELGKLLA
ncbi:hypothetical protein VitviT2T_013971 [Vitis vinifera]|uniref:Histone H2A n=1 Tax=Vitis vinifera TaxID=29760 RepID=A0ABY9CKT4_VITVI|nr:hypothetical protein VitviT2T_013971 [Vitis vinifera]